MEKRAEKIKLGEDYFHFMEGFLDTEDLDGKLDVLKALSDLMNVRGRNKAIMESELEDYLKQAGFSANYEYAKSILRIMGHKVLPTAKQNKLNPADNDYWGIASEDNPKTIQRLGAQKFSVECMECGKVFKTSSSEPKCPKCGSYDVDLPSQTYSAGSEAKYQTCPMCGKQIGEGLCWKGPEGDVFHEACVFGKEKIDPIKVKYDSTRSAAYSTRLHPNYIDPESFNIGDRVMKIFGEKSVSPYSGKVVDVSPATYQVIVAWPWSVEYEDPSFLINLSEHGWSKERDRNQDVIIQSNIRRSGDLADVLGPPDSGEDLWDAVELRGFTDEMEAESFMMENVLETGFYKKVGDKFVVYEWQPRKSSVSFKRLRAEQSPTNWGKDTWSAGPIKSVKQLKAICENILSCVQDPSKMASAAKMALRSPDYVLARPAFQNELLDIQKRIL
jgi:hypothetical protein